MNKEIIEIKQRKEEQTKSGALQTLERMAEKIKLYEESKETLSLDQKEEISKELAKSEANLSGLSETQEFSEAVKVNIRLIIRYNLKNYVKRAIKSLRKLLQK